MLSARTNSFGLQARGLSKLYGTTPVLEDISFSLPEGETLAVIGPSGCGKSTLLYLLAGLTPPSAGQVLPERGEKAGSTAFILQEYGLFPWKTVAANLALPLELQKVSPEACQKKVQAMLAELGLNGLENRFPAQLSGGQRQRTAIGRALITEPRLLLMDEPFSSLDALTREHAQQIVLDLWQRRRPTCVLVTHTVAEALFLGQHIMIMDSHPGRQRLWLDNPCFGKAGEHLSITGANLIRQIYAAMKNEEDV